MIANVTITTPTRDWETKAGDLNYGTLVTGVESHPNSIYIKVNKEELGQDLRLQYPGKHSVFLNIRTGTLRAIPEGEIVKVLRGELNAHLTFANNYKR